MSPVRNQPSGVNAAAVASGRLRYSVKRFGPRTWISPTDSPSYAARGAVVLDQPQLHPRQRDSDRAGPRFAVGADAGVHEGLRHAVPLDHPAAGRRRDPFVVVHRQRGRTGDEEAGPAECLREVRVGGQGLREAVVHRRDAEQHRRAGRQLPGDRGRLEPAQVADRAAAAQWAEDAQDQAVHVEEGRAWTSTSSAVHCQASASASRVVATARRGMTAPLGGPVVPEV